MVGASANSPEDLQRKNPPCGLPRAIREGPARCSAARDMGAICSHGVTRGWYVDSSWVAGTARQNEDAVVTPTRGKSMSILGHGPIIVHKRRLFTGPARVTPRRPIPRLPGMTPVGPD